ncbi:ABC transporter substrate-binding protein [Pseudomonas jilinensis]|uniref:ABC transporter substrate-binding protein n=1 Tax=Pseudomonas jilinensis TaxID=2078689 RepID=A0A396S0B3_9PSED|nr:ABC transporter substrate-binding protein [Pseudomonas jilinensis]
MSELLREKGRNVRRALIPLISTSLVIWPLTGLGSPLKWGYAPNDPAPYVVVENHQLGPSITLTLGHAVAERLGRSVRFIPVPNNRIDDALASHHINVICNTIPNWIEQPDRYQWSQVIYEDADIIINRLDQAPIHDLGSLSGAIVGTTLGYYYAPELTNAFNSGQVIRHDARNLPTRLNMLLHGRLDATIEFRRSAQYAIAQQGLDNLRLNDWVVEHFALQCVVSYPDPNWSRQVAEAIDSLVEDGTLPHLLQPFEGL